MGMSPRLLRPKQTLDADALRYILAVQSADGQPLESSVATAINSFVVGCKRDNIWSAIKAGCILCGARTLAGALVPLAGPTPTNVNFVQGDYNRKTGLLGNGGGKYLRTGYAASSNAQNDNHMGFYVTAADTASTLRLMMGTGESGSGSCRIWANSGANDLYFQPNTSGGTSAITGAANRYYLGLIAYSRTASNAFSMRAGTDTGTSTYASAALVGTEISVFRMTTSFTGSTQGTDSRIAFYSTGSSLNLATLDTRVSALISAIQAAIP